MVGVPLVDVGSSCVSMSLISDVTSVFCIQNSPFAYALQRGCVEIPGKLVASGVAFPAVTSNVPLASKAWFFHRLRAAFGAR